MNKQDNNKKGEARSKIQTRPTCSLTLLLVSFSLGHFERLPFLALYSSMRTKRSLEGAGSGRLVVVWPTTLTELIEPFPIPFFASSMLI